MKSKPGGVWACVFIALAAFLAAIPIGRPLAIVLVGAAGLLVWFPKRKLFATWLLNESENPFGKALIRGTIAVSAIVVLITSTELVPKFFRWVIDTPELEVGTATEGLSVFSELLLSGTIGVVATVLAYIQIIQNETQIIQNARAEVSRLLGDYGELQPGKFVDRTNVTAAIQEALPDLTPQGVVKLIRSFSKLGAFVPVRVDANGKAENRNNRYALAEQSSHIPLGKIADICGYIDGRRLAGRTIKHWTIFGERFVDVDFSYSKFEYCIFIACDFVDCNFTGADLTTSLFWIPGDHITPFHDAIFDISGDNDFRRIIDWKTGAGTGSLFRSSQQRNRSGCDFEGCKLPQESKVLFELLSRDCSKTYSTLGLAELIPGKPFDPRMLKVDWNNCWPLCYHQYLLMAETIELRPEIQEPQISPRPDPAAKKGFWSRLRSLRT